MSEHARQEAKCSRRTLVREMASIGALGAVASLAACGGDSAPSPTLVPTSSPTAPVYATPTSTVELNSTPLAAYQDPDKWRGRTLTVAAPGGSYQEAQTAAYFTPFENATGVSVHVVVYDTGILKQQVSNAKVVWDACCVPTEDVIPLGRGAYLTPIDYAVVDQTALFGDLGIAMQYGVGADFYSTVIAYGAGLSDLPQSWADFWDTSRFGTGRALRKSPVGTLEFALLADGVAMRNLYPLDMDRAFASLERLYPSVVSWYEDAQQPVQLVLAGESGLSAAWNVRIAAPDIGGQVLSQWNGGMLSADSWVVPAGAGNVDVAMDFINFATRDIPQANFCNLLPFGPVNPSALAHILAERLPDVPTSDQRRPVQFVENWNYWIDQRDALTSRFDDWLTRDRSPGTPANATVMPS